MSDKETELMNKDETNNGMVAVEGGVKLKRELGLFSAVNLILGVMIGSGIFVSPSSALEYSGSVALCLVIWIISGVISLLGALSFAELGTVVGKSGAEYAYFQEAFGKMHVYWGPLPAFICAWVYVIVLRPAEVAIIVMTFAEYSIRSFTEGISPDNLHGAIILTSLLALFYGDRLPLSFFKRLLALCAFLLTPPAKLMFIRSVLTSVVLWLGYFNVVLRPLVN